MLQTVEKGGGFCETRDVLRCFSFVGGKSWLAFVRKPMIFVQVRFFFTDDLTMAFFCWKTSKGSATSLDLQRVP